jgi:predicted DNA-binding transcriptional regulator AlpA
LSESKLPNKVLRFKDLAKIGINNWPTLRRRIQQYNFPPGRYVGENTRVWTEEEVAAWFDSRPKAWPPPEKAEPTAPVCTGGSGGSDISSQKRRLPGYSDSDRATQFLLTKSLNCARPLKEPRKLKDFCDYSCRGQHSVKGLDGAKYQTGLSGSKNTRKTKALRSLRKQSAGHFTFSKINSVTFRIDRQGKNGVGWLMEVAWPVQKPALGCLRW